MCGLVGFLAEPGSLDPEEARGVAERMAKALAHRGPDSAGAWVDAAGGLAFGHRRLAIVDLSETGAQPMHSHDGRFVCAFNGEIYNFGELRSRLESQGVRFKGSSDTEVLLETIARDGVEAALRAAEGMFALALWDRETRTLTLARDRFGEKPLTWGIAGRSLLFASEARAFWSHPHFTGHTDDASVSAFLMHTCVPRERSIFAGFQKVAPGTLVEIKWSTGTFSSTARAWWSATEHLRSLPRERLTGHEGVEQLQQQLLGSVSRQLVADVPVGVFLSGGIDSATIAALARRATTAPVRTFTMGFHEAEFDEAPRARQIAAHLGTEHSEAYVGEAEALAVVPQLGALYDEPFADSSQIPTVLVSRLARQHVTVCLAGDGGDELFAGYLRYTRLARMWKTASRIPSPLRQALAALASRAQLPALKLPSLLRRATTRFERYRTLAAQHEAEPFLSQLTMSWRVPPLRPNQAPPPLAWPVPRIEGLSLEEELMLGDLLGPFPDDLLTKMDRAAMSASLEVRLPFLSPGVVETAWRIPFDDKVRGAQTKHVLREVLRRFLPSQLVDGPKRGFTVPLGRWVAGPLRDWAHSMLDVSLSAFEHLIDPSVPRRLLSHQLQNPNVRDHRLWSVLMLGAWQLAQKQHRP